MRKTLEDSRRYEAKDQEQTDPFLKDHFTYVRSDCPECTPRFLKCYRDQHAWLIVRR